MSLAQKLSEWMPSGDSQSNDYECNDCGREFEVDAPPERVICSECGSEDVESQ